MSDRFTVRLDDENAEWVEQQHEERDRSRAWIINEVLRAVRGDDSTYAVQDGEVRTGADRTDVLDELKERIETLEESARHREERISALESRDVSHEDGRETGAEGDDESPTTPPDAHSSGVSASQDTPDAGGGEQPDIGGDERPPSSVRELLEDWRPGKGREDRERRREVGVVVLETLRDDGRMSAGDFKQQLFPEHAVGDEKVKSWWERTAREAINHAREAGVVVLHGGRNEYEWVGF